MGTDIHTVFQKQDGNNWIDIPSDYQENRHYLLFSWLANVRNGFGFAGVKTCEPILPISIPRGLPSDFECINDTHTFNQPNMHQKYGVYKWMGDHSYSWLLGSEILSSKPPKTRCYGVLSRQEYIEWDRTSRPNNVCSSIFGKDVVVNKPDKITDNTTHVMVEWLTDSSELNYFIDEIKRLVDLHGNIRMVFGFDS